MHLSEGSEGNKSLKYIALYRELNSGRLEYEVGVNFASFAFACIFLFLLLLLRHKSALSLALASLAADPHFVLSKDLFLLFSSLFLILLKLKMFHVTKLISFPRLLGFFARRYTLSLKCRLAFAIFLDSDS